MKIYIIGLVIDLIIFFTQKLGFLCKNTQCDNLFEFHLVRLNSIFVNNIISNQSALRFLTIYVLMLYLSARKVRFLVGY